MSTKRAGGGTLTVSAPSHFFEVAGLTQLNSIRDMQRPRWSLIGLALFCAIAVLVWRSYQSTPVRVILSAPDHPEFSQRSPTVPADPADARTSARLPSSSPAFPRPLLVRTLDELGLPLEESIVCWRTGRKEIPIGISNSQGLIEFDSIPAELDEITKPYVVAYHEGFAPGVLRLSESLPSEPLLITLRAEFSLNGRIEGPNSYPVGSGFTVAAVAQGSAIEPLLYTPGARGPSWSCVAAAESGTFEIKGLDRYEQYRILAWG